MLIVLVGRWDAGVDTHVEDVAVAIAVLLQHLPHQLARGVGLWWTSQAITITYQFDTLEKTVHSYLYPC